jgi:hypothetical protein
MTKNSMLRESRWGYLVSTVFSPQMCLRRDDMNQKCVDKLIGKYCKIVTKEPGDEKSYVVVGTVKDVDHDAGFITVEFTQGLGCLSINTIIAIKSKANR